MFKRDNGNVHRAAANIIVSKSRAARVSMCNVLLSRDFSSTVSKSPRLKVESVNAFGVNCFTKPFNYFKAVPKVRRLDVRSSL